MLSTLIDELINRYEKEFLEEKSRIWGWQDDDALIFIERMLCSNKDKTNSNLDVRLNLAENRVASTLSSKVFPQLEQLGCPKNDWKSVQRWLQQVKFPQWVCEPLWRDLWLQAVRNPQMKLQTLRDGLQTAGHGACPEDLEMPIRVLLGSQVAYHVPMHIEQHLILLEQDGNKDVFCLTPWRADRYQIGKPIGKEEVIAIVSDTLLNLTWLQEARQSQEPMQLDYRHLGELVSRGDLTQYSIWRLEFEIIAV